MLDHSPYHMLVYSPPPKILIHSVDNPPYRYIQQLMIDPSHQVDSCGWDSTGEKWIMFFFRFAYPRDVLIWSYLNMIYYIYLFVYDVHTYNEDTGIITYCNGHFLNLQDCLWALLFQLFHALSGQNHQKARTRHGNRIHQRSEQPNVSEDFSKGDIVPLICF